MQRKRLLVTGGSGFVGANLLLENDHRETYGILNLDTAEPKFLAKLATFLRCDLLDPFALNQAFCDFLPTHVVHLAGRTDMFGAKVEDYAANHIGTANVVAAIQQTPSVQNVDFTSSQYVFGPGSLPKGDEDYRPHTIYGESKVESEKTIRSASLSCRWTIIRPTNIWGRWHPRYPSEFWRVLKQGRYVHPGGAPITRCYGYVGTVVDQIFTILERQDESLDRRTFYVGDPPIDIYEWTNAFSLELRRRPVRVVPRWLLRSLALVGDTMIRLGGNSLFSVRAFEA